jgi:hypothetical protein
MPAHHVSQSLLNVSTLLLPCLYLPIPSAVK